MTRPEILAPAGDMTCLQAALDAGADAVYLGLADFNMRARSGVNFTRETLPEASRRCRARGVKLYLALNAIVFEGELAAVEGLIVFAKPLVDAFIVADWGVIALCRKHGAAFHVSTQMSCSNSLAARFLKEQGAARVVLARECTLGEVREIARKVDLSDEQLKKAVSQLSGGQQQRVAIARALVTGPAIICMDEPLSNLDAKLRVQLRNELKKMQKDFGITTIYVTHDQEEALTLSDRIAVFNKGIIEQIGTPNEVYNHSQTEFVCNFIGDINRLNDDTVSALRAAGAEVDASKHNYIRLERLHVNVAPRSGEIALDGTVENCEYYGLYIKYYIHVGTQSLKVIEKNDGVNIYDPGQRVKVILNPNDIMAYAPSAEEVE